MLWCIALPSLQARDSLERFQVDPVSGISSVSLGELLEGVNLDDQEEGMDSGTTGTRRENKESEL